MKTIKDIRPAVIGGILFSAFLASCSVQKYSRPEVELPQAFRNSEQSADTVNIAGINYREFFRDTVLVALIDSGIRHNNDLRVAIKQIEYASLGYTQSKWANVPTVSATIAGATVSRPSDNSLNGQSLGYFVGQKYIGDYNTSINIAWEADIWGKIRGAKEEALTELLRTQEAAKAVQTRLVSEIVSGYYNLLMLDKQQQITQENLSFADSTLTILKKQQELGMITLLAVQQQEMTRDQIRKSIPAIESAISVQENALSVLTGRLPDRIERNAGLDDIQTPEKISTGVPAEMLAYRPDVKSSELIFRKSIASIHVAKVSMYPAINITAQGGLNAFKEANWFNIPGSLFGLVGGSIAQPILNGKQLKTRYRQAQVASEQAEINFRQSVLGAVGEVSDALVQIEKLGQQQAVAEGMVITATEAVENAITLYRYNGATYLEVILAQSGKLQAELDLASLKTQKLGAITALYRSLGGGWQ